jgi:hypothetical protein
MPIAAITVEVSAEEENSNQSFLLNDDTGTYNAISKPFGYGIPTGLAAANVTSTTLAVEIFISDGTSSVKPTITIFPTVANPAPFAVGQVYRIFQTDLGFTAAEKFPDGIYKLTYTVVGTVGIDTVTYKQIGYFPFIGNVTCCIKSLLDVVEFDCACSAEGDVNELFKNFMKLEGICADVNCNKTKRALQTLGELEKFCSSSGCPNCGC